MTTVHLSWFSEWYNWFKDEALDYVFDFFSKIFSEAGNWLVGALESIISSVMESALGSVVDSLLEFFFAQLYAVMTTILMILDCIEDCFNVASGLTPVYRQSGNTWVEMPLLNAVFFESSIQNTIWIMITVGFVLCFFCAILATAKSIFEMDGSNSKPVGHVIRQTGKAMLFFVLVPMMAAFLISLSGVLLNTVDKALTGDQGKTSVARTIFTISTFDAIDTEKNPDGVKYNSSYTGQMPSDFGVTDKFRRHFYYKDEFEIIPNYANPVYVKDIFTFRGIDYVIGLGVGIYFTIVLGMVLFIFICRIFEVTVLVVVEPFFIATMPLDDGEHFKKWAELFIGKLFAGFGMVAAMRMYLTITAALFANRISFVEPGSTGAAVQNYLIKLIFMAGGALGIKSIGPLITSIMSWEAAQSEQEQAAVGATKLGGKVAGFEAGRVGSLMQRMGSQMGYMAAGTATGIGYVGSETAGAAWSGMKKFGGAIKDRMSGSSSGKMQYDGGAPAEIPGERVAYSPAGLEKTLKGKGSDTQLLSGLKDINDPMGKDLKGKGVTVNGTGSLEGKDKDGSFKG